MMRGPPGCTAQEPISSIDKPLPASQAPIQSAARSDPFAAHDLYGRDVARTRRVGLERDGLDGLFAPIAGGEQAKEQRDGQDDVHVAHLSGCVLAGAWLEPRWRAVPPFLPPKDWVETPGVGLLASGSNRLLRLPGVAPSG